MANKLIFKIIFFLILSCSTNHYVNPDSNILEDLLSSAPDNLKQVLEQKDKFEIQILYSQVNRNQANHPSVKTYSYNFDPKQYFYPASTVKMSAAFLALEKINDLNTEGLTKYTPLYIDSAWSGQSMVLTDSTAKDLKPSIAHYIKKIFLVSDNDAYNRIYEFIGPKYFNENLWGKGYKNILMRTRLSLSLNNEENMHTNPFQFYEGEKIIYEQPAQYWNEMPDHGLDNLKRGKGYWNGEKVINEPFDFSTKNYISLRELHNILIAVMLPETVPAEKRFKLTEDDYYFLYKYMSMLPRESDYPAYPDSIEYYDSYVKFFLFGNTKKAMPKNIRIFNKVGLAYGYLIDVAYIVDFENKVEFVLSAVIHVNENRIFNDNKYEYDSVGIPFLAELGSYIYKYEKKREKAVQPDLARYKVH